MANCNCCGPQRGEPFCPCVMQQARHYLGVFEYTDDDSNQPIQPTLSERPIGIFMYCPKCEKEVHCGCGSCRKRRGDQPDQLVWWENGEVEECPYCGYAMHADGWMDAEHEQLIAEGKL